MARRKKVKKGKDETLIDIVEARDSAQDYFEKNKVLVMSVIGVIVLVVGGYLFYETLVKSPKEKSAMTAMYKAEEQFARDSFALALENPGGGFDGFLDIIDNYGGTDAANLAHYYAGISYLNLGRHDVAVAYLSDFNPDGKVTPIMKFGALGDAYSELGEMDKALSNYSKAADFDNEFLSPYFKYKYAMLLEKQGNVAEAKQVYQEIRDEYPDSKEASDVEKLLARLD